MMSGEITFMDQLLHYRAVYSKIESTRSSYNSRSSWFPKAQWKEYSQIYAVYADCLDKYGEEKFQYYARRNRIHKKYTDATLTESQKEKRKGEISMDHLAGYKVPRTTNGVYGSIRPSQLFFCSDLQN